jgi:hypothetical protein
MRRFVIAPAVALAIASAAGIAVASDDDRGPRVDVPRDQWMSIAQVADKLESQGYRVREIETEHGAYEVSVYDKDGRRSKLYLHPATGEVLRGKPRDD